MWGTDLEAISLYLLFGFSVFVGVLIGCVGIGGVLLVPFLTYILGFSVHMSIAAAMFGYIFVGIVGAILYARHGSIEWSKAIWMVLGAMPAAYFGAFLVSIIPASGLELIISMLVLFAGLNALFRGIEVTDERQISNPLALLTIGSITGAGSALTGTGGPLIAVPILVSLKVSGHAAIGFSQAVQSPLATLATFGNFLYGIVNVSVGSTVAAGLMVGGYFGAKLALTLKPTTMSILVAWVLVIVGLILLGKMLIANI